MPTFLEDFAASVRERQDCLKRKMVSGKFNPLHQRFREYFDFLWIPTGFKHLKSSMECEILAVDSSVYRNLLSTGGVFYIVRSLAVHRSNSWKRLETDVIFTRKGIAHINLFIGIKMELLEFEAAIDALQSGLEADALLIDGSLYGRAVHLPIEFKVEEEPDLMVRYFQAYWRLLNLCKAKNVLLLGVSKESRSTFFRDYILSLIFNRELEKAGLPAETANRLREIFSGILDDETAAFQKFERLKHGFKGIPETFELIFQELASSRPDHQLIMSLTPGTGYTRPLLLGPPARMLRRLSELRLNPKEHVRRYFPKATRERGGEFVDKAVSILLNMLEFPSFMSFHVLLDSRDSPIRVDIPVWNHRLCDVSWPKPVEESKALAEALEILEEGYGGLPCHNIWLKDVDEKVRLRRRVVDEVYIPFMENLLHVKLIRGRGYRRVKYP